MTLRNKFKNNEIIDALQCAGGNFTQAAKDLTSLKRGKVSRQTLKYWSTKMDTLTTDKAVELDDFVSLEAQKRTAQVNNNKLRKITRDVLDAERTKDDVLQGIQLACAAIAPIPPINMEVNRNPSGKKMTIELLFSDLQIGKLMDTYNTQLAIARLREYSEVVIERIKQYLATGYDVERIVLASLGDIIESDKKHINSARATDTGTATQLADAITYITTLVIEPLALLGIPMDFVGITGNHDHDDHGLLMFKPGKEQLSWPMYHSMRMICEAKGFDHVNFIIPEGAFHVDSIYNCHVLYEHGVGVAASEAGMRKRMADRTKQIKQYITLFRMGDKHNICRFNNDTMVVNGAFFGDDRTGSEYSGICGYDGYPAQIMFAHVPRADNYRTTIFDSLAIQLGHVV